MSYSFGSKYDQAVALCHKLEAYVELASSRRCYYSPSRSTIYICPEQIENHYENLIYLYQGKLTVDAEEIAIASLFHELGHHILRGNFSSDERQQEEVKAWKEAETFYFCLSSGYSGFPEYIHLHINRCLNTYGYYNWEIPIIESPKRNKLWEILNKKLF